MTTLVQTLGIRHPIIQAPMAGGPGTPALAAAVTNAGGLGFVAGGYSTPGQIEAEVRATRELTEGPFGVNLFAGGYHQQTDRDPTPILQLLGGIHAELGLPPPSLPAVPSDPFEEQLAMVLRLRPRVFSFTFGVPSADVLRDLRAAGITTLGTATTKEEAAILCDAGVDAVIAQGAEAGAHRGTFAAIPGAPEIPTLTLVREMAGFVNVPVIASGGIMSGSDIAEALRAGAEAVQMGTAFLACPEAGTAPAYRDAVLHAAGDQTVVTRAFSGRAARGLRNAFIDRVEERDELILPFPIQNSLTRPMRAAATQRGNPEYLSLWAGTGVARIRSMPAAELIEALLTELRLAQG